MPPQPEFADIATLREAGLSTCSYSAFRPAMGVPVRTSVGPPRFWRLGELSHARAVSPYGVFGNRGIHPDDQRAAYLLRLRSRAELVIEELAGIAADHPGQPLVLLCFERDREDCHRSWLADWLHDEYQLDAPEAVR